MGPIPRLPARKASFPNMVCSLPQGITSRQEAGHPAYPPPVTPEHRATPLGPPSPCPGDHRKCQQSESQENSPPAQSEGAGCRQRGLPLRGPSPLRRTAQGRLAEGPRPGPASQCRVLKKAGRLCRGQGWLGKKEGGGGSAQAQESYWGLPHPGWPAPTPLACAH